MAENSYRQFAALTFNRFTPLSQGKPWGYLELLSGLGLGAPAFRSFRLIGMFLAFEAVPHGGPKWTASTLPDRTSHDEILNPILRQVQLDSCRLQSCPFQVVVDS